MVKSLECEGCMNMNSTQRLKALNQTHSNHVNTEKHSGRPVRSWNGGQEKGTDKVGGLLSTRL